MMPIYKKKFHSNLLHCRQVSLPAEPQGKPKNTGVGSLSLLQWIFPTQESNQGLLHCRWILYQVNFQGSPNILCKVIYFLPCYANTDFPGGISGKAPTSCQWKRLRDVGSIPGLRRSPGGGHGNPLQCSCLENPMDRGAWRALVCWVTKSQTKPHMLILHDLLVRKNSPYKVHKICCCC